jgi:hypothetical protein
MAQLAAADDPFLKEAARQGRGDAQAGIDPRDREAVFESIAAQAGPVPDGRDEALYEEYKRQFEAVEKREALVDAGSEMSFPASDPPSYMAGATVVGAPPPGDESRGRATTGVSDPDEVRPSKDDVTNPPPGQKSEEAARGGKTK